ncbi:MAG: radical SAM protein [Nanoarchaeota archaeon]
MTTTSKHIQLWTIPQSSQEKNMNWEEGVGVYKLATIATALGYTTYVYQSSHYQYDHQIIIDRITSSPPDTYLGFSVYSQGISMLERILCNPHTPSRPVLIGGPGATVDPKEILHRIPSRYPIAVVQGEGESIFQKLLEIPVDTWNSLPVWTRTHDGKIQHGIFQTLQNLEKSPFISLDGSQMRQKAISLIDDHLTNLETRLTALKSIFHSYIETRRGCFYKCEFCSEPMLSTTGVRRMSPERAVNEFDYLYEHHGIVFFNLVDNIAFDDVSWWECFSRELKKRPYSQWVRFGGYGTPKFFSHQSWKELLPYLYDAGLCFFTIGVQSGSPRILRHVIHRPQTDPQDALNITEYATTLGIQVKADFIIGHPTETLDDLQQTLTCIEKLYNAGAQIFVRRLTIVPHSGYDLKLQEHTYELPALTHKHINLVERIFSYHCRKDRFASLMSQRNNPPNIYLIDRKNLIQWPRTTMPMHAVKQHMAALQDTNIPELLKYRYTRLYELTLAERSEASKHDRTHHL